MANNKVLFNDKLGTTIARVDIGKLTQINRDVFGDTNSPSGDDFFTGKPHVEGLGYAFLFRNYRSELGKWQTGDPLGYPDGWNNLAYCNNLVTGALDSMGTEIIAIGGAGEGSLHNSLQDAMNTEVGAGNYTLFHWDDSAAITAHINSLPEGEPVVIVGHSWGGATAWNIANNSNTSIDGLITLDPVAWFTNFFGGNPDSADIWKMYLQIKTVILGMILSLI